MASFSHAQDKLIGALIGLARPTDGNEHLISPTSTTAIAAGLKALSSGETGACALGLKARARITMMARNKTTMPKMI